MRNLIFAALLLCAAVSTGGSASAQSASQHSDNMTLLANWNNKGEYGQGSDMAFWGDRAVLGSYAPGGFRLMDIATPSEPRQISFFHCPGTQADVSMWRDIVIVSVDAPRGATSEEGEPIDPTQCGAGAASQAEIEAGTAWEGLRIVSIANPAAPVQLAALKTDCGSHTHTLYPDEANGRLLAYVLSYPLGAPYPSCNAASHRKISVVEIPLSNPAAAKVLGTADVSPNIGCHDVSVFPARKLAAAGCISESQIWDISDPAKPKVLAHIANPENQIHHSAAFSWDGNVVVFGDELGGAVVSPGCASNDGRFAGLWFYDITDPAQPTIKGNYRLPQHSQSALCTAHLFNVVPLRSERNILVSSWYEGGTSVVDFTDPSKPEQIAFHIPKDPTFPGDEAPEANQWSAYWYNGNAYANNFAERGFDVFSIRHPALAAAIELPYLNPQVQEPLPPPAQTPHAPQSVGMPPATKPRPGCTDRRAFRLRLRAPKGQRLRSAVVFVGGRRHKVVRGRALARPVRLRRLPRGRTRVDVTLVTVRGKRIHRSRTYRFC